MSRRLELLELLLSPLKATPTQFTVTVTQSPAGEGSAESFLPFIDGEQDWRSTVIRALELTSFNPEYFTPEEQDWMVRARLLADKVQVFHPHFHQTIGQVLYRALIPPDSKVKSLLNESIQIAKTCGAQLLVQLKFEEDTVQVARLPDYPWELIHDGTGFLLHNQVGFSRYIAFSAVPPSLPAVEQVKVLLISSGALDKVLGFEPLPKEGSEIAEKLKAAIGSQRIQLEELPRPTLDELAAYLTCHSGKEAPHLLHFDGHGLFGKLCSACSRMHKGIKAQQCQKCGNPLPDAQGYLLFEDEYGAPDYVSASQLGSLLQQTRQSDGRYQTGGVAALVLSACQSGMAVEGESVFRGVAQNLIYHGVPAIVAMQYSVTVKGAIAFTKQFYLSIGEKNSLAVAVSQGRAMMRVDGNQWYRPVLYLRWQDNKGGQLFATPKPPADISRSSGDFPRSQKEHTELTFRKLILVLSANPEHIDTPRRLEEIETITNALDRATLARSKHNKGSTIFDSPLNKLNVRASELSQELSIVQSAIVCISGNEAGIEGLMLEGNYNKNKRDLEKLQSIVDFFRLYSEKIDCVILNGCYYEEQAREIAQYIESVIGIDRNLKSANVLEFFSEFCYQLNLGNTVQASHHISCNRLERIAPEDYQPLPKLFKRDDEIRQRELEEKLTVCNKEIEKDQNNVELWRKKASLLENLDRDEEADQAYEKASFLDPSNYKIRTEQGDALEKFGKHEEAVNAYEKALELEQKDYRVWWKKGKALVEVKQYQEASEAYDNTVALKPPPPDNYVICREYGSLLKKMERYRESINLYQKSLAFEPKYRASSYEKKRVYKKMYSRKK